MYLTRIAGIEPIVVLPDYMPWKDVSYPHSGN